MTCLLKDPNYQEAARQARRNAYHNAKDEDGRLAAAESTWEEYVPPCSCPECNPADEARSLMKTQLLIHRIGDEDNYALWWTLNPEEVTEALQLCTSYGGELRSRVDSDEPLAYPLHEGPEELYIWLTFAYIDHDEAEG